MHASAPFPYIGPSKSSLGLATSTGATGRPSPTLRSGSTPFTLLTARHFVYGPGEGGVTVEYLYSAPGAGEQLLVSRQGSVNNLGSNSFSLGFDAPLRGYEVAYSPKNAREVLAAERPLEGNVELGGPTDVMLRTTYLSEQMWILRDASGQPSVYARTETRSVMDRRGLVADGQLKPPDDEQVCDLAAISRPPYLHASGRFLSR